MKKCDRCFGTGREPGGANKFEDPCRKCEGSGFVDSQGDPS